MYVQKGKEMGIHENRTLSFDMYYVCAHTRSIKKGEFYFSFPASLQFYANLPEPTHIFHCK